MRNAQRNIMFKLKLSQGCLLLLVTAFLLVFSFEKSEAQQSGLTGFNLQIFQPTYSAGNHFHLEKAQTLDQFQFSFKLENTFRWNQILKIDTGANFVNIIKTLNTIDHTIAFGIFDFLEVGVHFPVHAYARLQNINTLQRFHTSSLGDLRAGVKINFWTFETDRTNNHFGFIADTSIPTGNHLKFLGWERMTPSFRFLYTREMPKFNLTVNMGMRFPRSVQIQSEIFREHLMFGVGVDLPVRIFRTDFQFFSELNAQVQFRDVTVTTSPFELTAGLQKTFWKDFVFSFGLGSAITNSPGNSSVKGILQLGYKPHLRKESVVESDYGQSF